MDINTTTRVAANDSAAFANTSLQTTKFTERKQREAQSDVKSEAVFYSPVIRIDRDTQAAVMQYRDTQTGEVKNEYPNKKAANVYQKADATVEKPVVKAKPEKPDGEIKADAKTDVKVEIDVAEEPPVSINEDA